MQIHDARVRAAAITAVCIVCAIARADPAPGSGIKGTAHDFTGSGAKVGLCTYCHTPHKAGSTLLLWNHRLSTNVFRWDVAATTAGTMLPAIGGATYKGTSSRCLSCHDGSVAAGEVGWYDARSHLGAAALPSPVVGTAAVVGASGSLAGNHPVGVPYPFNKTANTYNGITTGKLMVASEWQADPVSLPGSHIRLFKDDGAGNMSLLGPGMSTSFAGIECSSCHDPHNQETLDRLFLRGRATGSTQADGYICLQCHVA